jgi:uncharacterized protein YwbE
MRPDSNHIQFFICKTITDPKTGNSECNKQFSDPISKDLDSAVFNFQFEKVFTKSDSTIVASINDTVNKQSFEKARDDMYEKSKEFMNEKKDGSEQAELINKKLDDLFNEKTNNLAIGYFKLKEGEIKVAEVDNKSESLLNIKSVEIVLSSGSIRKNGIKVELEDGRIFRNKNSPITLYRFDKRKADKLLVDDTRKSKSAYIELGNAFNYVYIGKFDYPSDIIAHLSQEQKSDSVFVTSTIGDLLDMSVYSDLLALLGRKANGIIQTEVTGTFITNTNILIPNSDLIFNNFMKPYFSLSKFDSKFAQLDTVNFKVSGNDSIINRLYLNQIAYLKAGIKANLLRLGIGNNQQLFLNFSAEINLTNADSLLKKDLVSINYIPELEYTINRLDNFGLDCSIRYMNQVVPKNSLFDNKNSIWIFNPQVSIYYYPFSNPSNKIYVKYSHFAQIGNGSYNYPQFQLGFKTNLFSKKTQQTNVSD